MTNDSKVNLKQDWKPLLNKLYKFHWREKIDLFKSFLVENIRLNDQTKLEASSTREQKPFDRDKADIEKDLTNSSE